MIDEQIPFKAPDTSSISDDDTFTDKLKKFPWWFVMLILIIAWAYYIIFTRENFLQAFNFIKIGLQITITTSLIAYAFAVLLGLFTGLGRISKNLIINNLARLYVEFVRGIPMLVLIFFIALVGVPAFIDGLKALGDWLGNIGLEGMDAALNNLTNQAISMRFRAIVARI